MAYSLECKEFSFAFSQLNQLNKGYALGILQSLNFAQENLLEILSSQAEMQNKEEIHKDKPDESFL